MITKELDGLKKCCVYANDFHLEMILLPYIKENLSETKFVILTENNLEETVKILLERITLAENYKAEIFNINWKNEKNKKIDYMKECLCNDEKITVIIKGSLNYINDILNIIMDFDKNNIDIIRCYSVEELNETHINLSDCEVLNTKRI